MDTAVLLLGLLVGLALGAAGAWALVSARARATVAEAARTAADASAMARADAAGVRAERAGLVARVAALDAQLAQTLDRLRAAESDAAGAHAAARSAGE